MDIYGYVCMYVCIVHVFTNVVQAETDERIHDTVRPRASPPPQRTVAGAADARAGAY